MKQVVYLHLSRLGYSMSNEPKKLEKSSHRLRFSLNFMSR